MTSLNGHSLSQTSRARCLFSADTCETALVTETTQVSLLSHRLEKDRARPRDTEYNVPTQIAR